MSMKHFILIFLIIANALSVTAQKESATVAHEFSDKLAYRSSIGIGIPLSDADDRGVSFLSSVEYQLLSSLSAGVGTGIEHCNHTFLPLFANLNWNVYRVHNVVVPLLSCNAGYSFSLNKQTSGGLYFAPSVGVIVYIKGRNSLFCTIGYESQNYRQKVTFSSSQILTQYIANECNSCILVKVGWVY